MKIAVIGYSGSGKSTLAARLAEKQGVPVLYMDTVHWLPGWKEREREEKRAIVTVFLDENDDWVIDGNYKSDCYERRMEEADKIVFLAFGRLACLRRVIRRYRENKGRARASMTEGCEERLPPDFLLWVFHTGRTKKRKRVYYDTVKRYTEKSTVIRNQKQLDAFYEAEGLFF